MSDNESDRMRQRDESQNDHLTKALDKVNDQKEIHKGPREEIVREANAEDSSEPQDKKLSADDSGE